MPPRVVLREGLRLGRRLMRGYLREATYRSGLRKIDARILKSALRDRDLTNLPRMASAALAERSHLAGIDRNEIIGAVRDLRPDLPAKIIQEAECISDHRFDLLGSGSVDLGANIDWHHDFKSGYSWDPTTYFRQIEPARYPGGHDIKVPWELSRCQHLVRLGQAYWISGDEKYANEFVAQLLHWQQCNPWPHGVNWVCTMDVAIRAVNWLLGLSFFVQSPTVTEAFITETVTSLLVHGRHVISNLEGSPENPYTSNHYVSNLVGLVYLGICCPYLKEAEGWLEVGWRELQRELIKQVHSDGANYEGSIPYHRLVLELMASAALLGRHNKLLLSGQAAARLERMFEFVQAYTRPDGTAPIIGDADDGRLHRLGVWSDPASEWEDHRYLLAIGSTLFDRADFAASAQDQWQEAIWLTGNAPGDAGKAPTDLPRESEAFTDAGIYVLRSADHHVVVRRGDIGTNGIGNHTHGDAMSVDVCSRGVPIIVDPGA